MIEKISPIPSFPKRGIRKKGSFPKGNTAEGFHAKERGPTEKPEEPNYLKIIRVHLPLVLTEQKEGGYSRF